MSNPEYIEGVKGLAGAFRALADPYRLQVFLLVRRLIGDEVGSQRSLDMADIIEEAVYNTNMSPAVVEHHLLDLSRAHLLAVTDAPDGRVRVSLDGDMFSEIRAVMEGGQ
jgi:DNA-binding transcriptional ArsR family regulator